MERVKADRVGRDFPIVCVGGSAGGLDAYIRLLQNLPNDIASLFTTRCCDFGT